MKESIKNVLDMYKEGSLSPEDAERLIEALWDGGEKGSAVPWDNDNKLRVVAYRGRRLVKRGEAGDKLFELRLEGDVQDLECWGSAECGQVFGNASSGGGMTVREGVGGNASACGGMEIGGRVEGNASAGGGFSSGGDIGGRVSAGGSVTCNDVTGNVTTGGNVTAGRIEGSVRANSVRCESVGGEIADNGRKRESARRSFRGMPADLFDDEDFTEMVRNAENISGVDVGAIIRNALGRAQDTAERGRSGRREEGRDETVTVADDGDLEIVALQNGERIASSGTGELVLRLEGSVENVRSEISVTVDGAVAGSVSAGGPVTCGSVEGDVTAGGPVTCDSVEGDVSAGSGVTAGNVEGDVKAGGDVHCDAVSGDVRADGDVECGSVEGSVSAGGSVTVEGDVGGDVSGSVPGTGTEE